MKRGFTVFELIAALIIAAIIVLAAAPIVMIIVDNARRDAFESTAHSLLKTAENECLANQLNKIEEDIWIAFENGNMVGDIISYFGTLPSFGAIKVTSECEISMAIHDGLWCIEKRFADNDFRITNRGIQECNIEIGALFEIQYVDELIFSGYIPVADAEELSQISAAKTQLFGKGTLWEDNYLSGLDQKYVQVGHINLENSFSSIGDEINPFTGVYNGNNLNINNLNINGEFDYQGFFGYLKNAEISKIRFNNAHVNGLSNLGILAGKNDNSLIDQIRVVGNVAGDSNIGCLVGYNNGIIENSSGNCIVHGSFETAAVGGLVGLNKGKIMLSYSSGIISNGYDSGGLVGINEGSIKNAYATNVVNGKGNIGGLVGNLKSSGTISNSYAIGRVDLNDNGQGGGLVGNNSGGQIRNSYYDSTTTGMSDTNKGIARTTDQMLNSQKYHNWDFTNVWQIHRENNNGYPFLLNNN